MDSNQIITFVPSQNNPNNSPISNQIFQNPEPNTKEQFQTQTNLEVGIVAVNPNILQNPTVNLNIKVLNFLQLLGSYNKLKIVCNSQNCAVGCRSVRSHQVIGINDKGEENLIMTASQEALLSSSFGYMLVYKSNNVIFGTLGYQNNPLNRCCGCDCCGCDCCTICCAGCCQD